MPQLPGHLNSGRNQSKDEIGIEIVTLKSGKGLIEIYLYSLLLGFSHCFIACK